MQLAHPRISVVKFLYYSLPLHGWLDVTRSRDAHGDIPLHMACRNGHVDIVKYLVSEQGCSGACQNKNGNTPLHMTCK